MSYVPATPITNVEWLADVMTGLDDPVASPNTVPVNWAMDGELVLSRVTDRHAGGPEE